MKQPRAQETPSRPPQDFQRAFQVYRQGKLDQAKALCGAILAKQPRCFDALHLLGVLHYQQGHDIEALPCLEKALEVRPGNLGILVGLGLIYRRLRHFTKALASYDGVLAVEPDHLGALNNRANVLMELRRPAEALASYDKVLGLRPQLPEALNNRGNALSQLDRLEEAVASYDKALSLRPDFAEALKNRGYALLELERPNNALASFDRALALKPDDASMHNGRGNALKELERRDEALTCYDKALALRPDEARFHNNRGTALKDLKRPAEALTSYDEAIARNPEYAEAYNNKAIILIDVGRFDAAKQAIETAIKLAPTVPRYYNHLAECTRFTPGDPNLRAMEELAQDMSSLAIDERIQLHFGLGKALADIGDHEGAIRRWLDGNALKRSQMTYNNAADIDLIARTRVAFDASSIRCSAGCGDPSAIPIFILGMPRSGTTLIEQILASHPHVLGAGETGDLAAAARRISGSSVAQYSPEHLSRLSGRQLRHFGEKLLDRILAAAPSAGRITDKTPENFRFVGLIHMAFPNARIIHTRRNPIDTCLSCFSKLFAGNALPYTYDLADLGRFYRAYEALMAHWREVLPPTVMLEVQYEEVVADLEAQTRRILAHCGLEWDSRCLDFYKTERPVRTSSRTQVRQPIYKSSVGRWRAYEPFLAPLLAELELSPSRGA
jgi:tetratricopeptide (TPR) repeat protein